LYKKRAVYLSVSLLVTPLVSVAVEYPLAPVSSLELTLQQLPQVCPGTLSSFNASAQSLLLTFYRQQQFARSWSQSGRLDALLVQLEQLADDGLNPAGYQLVALRDFAQQPAASGASADCAEILTSHVYLQALQHLQYGRLQQAKVEPFWQPAAASNHQASGQLALALDVQAQRAMSGLADLPEAFQRARPDSAEYHALRAAYAQQRQQPLPIWPVVASGPLLRPDMQDPRVPVLLQRLTSEGYFPALASGELVATETVVKVDTTFYGPQDVAALKNFQQAHGLQADGVLGAGTLAALNVSPAARREQLRVNLERFRWLRQNVEATSLLINVAAAELTFFQEGAAVWQTRTQVGRAERQTPLLKSQVTRLTLNPRWGVPPTIFREDKLPEIRRDPDFLAKHELQVFDRDGNLLDATQVDWSNPGYVQLRQLAGPKNPLGRVALRFANPFSVYLHDTPSQQLFSKAPRAFSSGCVRVEQALQLSEKLLSAAELERVTALLATGKTYEFRLGTPMPLLLSYWTAEVDVRGQLRFIPDIYQHDATLSAALDRAML
jgi:murein L,D-transpeptidase YcbB/YkuD